LFALTVSERNNIQLKVYQITAKNNEKYKYFESLKAQKHQNSIQKRYFLSVFRLKTGIFQAFLVKLTM